MIRGECERDAERKAEGAALPSPQGQIDSVSAFRPLRNLLLTCYRLLVIFSSRSGSSRSHSNCAAWDEPKVVGGTRRQPHLCSQILRRSSDFTPTALAVARRGAATAATTVARRVRGERRQVCGGSAEETGQDQRWQEGAAGTTGIRERDAKVERQAPTKLAYAGDSLGPALAVAWGGDFGMGYLG